MAEEFDYTPDDFDDRDLTDQTRLPPGFYHMSVQDVEEDGGSEHDQLVLEFSVISPGDFTGSPYTQYTPTGADDWMRKLRLKIAIALGLTTLEDYKAGKARVEWDEAVGKECVVELIEDSYKSKKTGNMVTCVRAKWPNNFISLQNETAVKACGVVLAGKSDIDEDPFG